MKSIEYTGFGSRCCRWLFILNKDSLRTEINPTATFQLETFFHAWLHHASYLSFSDLIMYDRIRSPVFRCFSHFSSFSHSQQIKLARDSQILKSRLLNKNPVWNIWLIFDSWNVKTVRCRKGPSKNNIFQLYHITWGSHWSAIKISRVFNTFNTIQNTCITNWKTSA